MADRPTGTTAMPYTDRTSQVVSRFGALSRCAALHLERIRLDLSRACNPSGAVRERERETFLANVFEHASVGDFEPVYGFNRSQKAFLPKAIVQNDVPHVFTAATQFFSPTHGVIGGAHAPHAPPERHYRSFSAGDPVRLWATVGRSGASHLCCEIESGGRRYSFGFAYAGVGKLEARLGPLAHALSEAPGAIYSPDFLFARRLQQQYRRPQSEYLRLVAQGLLTPAHVAALRSRLDGISASDMAQLKVYRRSWPLRAGGDNLGTVRQARVAGETMQMLHDKFHDWALDEEDEDAEEWFDDHSLLFLRPPPPPPTSVIAYDYSYTFYYREQPYCELSRAGGAPANCTSFLHAIFPDLITCTLSSIVENPEWCTALTESECSRTGRPLQLDL